MPLQAATECQNDLPFLITWKKPRTAFVSFLTYSSNRCAHLLGGV